MPSVKGQNILIIGGTSGIGLAVAQLAASEGVTVTVASSSPSRVDFAVKQLRAASPSASISGQVCDISGPDVESKLAKLFADVTASTGRKLDHVVNTANVFKPLPLEELTYETVQASGHFMFNVPYLIAKLLPSYINPSHKSSLILTSGRLGQRSIKGTSLLAGHAAGLFGITRGLAVDLAPIRVNIVAPGVVDTPLLGSHRDLWVSEGAKGSPLNKVGLPEEVAEAYLYLMRDTNTTGETVNSNSGSLAS